MQGSKVQKQKRMLDPYNNQKPDASDKEGSPGMEEENEDGRVEVQKSVPQPEPSRYVPKLPYPQRQQRSKMNKNFQKFWNILIQLTFNIPFAEALEKMTSYARIMKKILSKKKRHEKYEIVAQK